MSATLKAAQPSVPGAFIQAAWFGGNLGRNPRNPDIRFLTLPEVEAILAATPPTELGRIDRLVYLTAVMTGMRRGEVVAIRWQDIDWDTRVIPRPTQLHPWRVRDTQITPIEPRCPARRSARR